MWACVVHCSYCSEFQSRELICSDKGIYYLNVQEAKMTDINKECETTVILEEYKELRQEIRTYLSRRQQSKNFAYLITLGVVGLDSSKLGFGFLIFWIAATLILFVWYDELRRIRAIYRVAAYIEIFIETKLSNLHWETLGARHSINQKWFRRIISNAEFPMLILTHAILGSFRLWPEYWEVSIFGILIAIYSIIIIGIKCVDISRNGRKKEVEIWRNIFIENQSLKGSCLQNLDNTTKPMSQKD